MLVKVTKVILENIEYNEVYDFLNDQNTQFI